MVCKLYPNKTVKKILILGNFRYCQQRIVTGIQMKTFREEISQLFFSSYIDSLDWWLKQEEVSPTLILFPWKY